jgi:excisionase family DNA binding protein
MIEVGRDRGQLDDRRASPRALSIQQFCGRYSIGRTKAYEEIAAGRLRAVKVGRRTLIPEDSAEAWLAALTGMPAAGAAHE